MVSSSLHHQQPVASPFAAASYGQSAPPDGHLQGSNGQMQPPNGQLQASNGQHQTSNGHQQTSDGQQCCLPGAGSQPVLLQTQPADQAQEQHSHLRQGQRPGPDLEQGLEPALPSGQGQGQVPAERQRQTAEEEDGEKAAPGGLEKGAEEKLRGISRLEEDALEAKVAGPIGQCFSSEKTPSHTPKQLLLHVPVTVKIPQAHAEMQLVMRELQWQPAAPRLHLAEHHALSVASQSMWWCDAGQVQISLIAEAVMWKRGILVMPPIVNQLVKAMQVSPALFDLSASVMLCQSSGTAWYAVPAVGEILWLLIEPHRGKLAQCLCKFLQTASSA